MEVSQFEWFTLENKVRKLFLELMEPITLKFADQKHLDDKMQDAIHSHKQRIEEHDIVIERLTRKAQLIEDISRKQNSFENAQRFLDSKMSEDLSALQSQFEASAHNSVSITATLRSFDTQLDTLARSFKSTSAEIVEIKSSVLEKLHLVKQKVDEQIQNCQEEIKAYEAVFKEANQKHEGLNSGIVNVDIKVMSCNQELEFLKLDLARLKKDDSIKERVNRLEESVMKTRQIFTNDLNEQDKELKKILAFVENVQPIKTHLQISEVLHNSLQGPQKKALAEYELQMFADLSTSPEFEHIKELVAGAQQRAVEAHETIVKEEEERAASVLQRPKSRDLPSRSRLRRRGRTQTATFTDKSLTPTATFQGSEEHSSFRKRKPGVAHRENLTLSFDEGNLASNEVEGELDDENEYYYSDEEEDDFEELDLTSFKNEILEEVKADTEEIREMLSKASEEITALTQALAEANSVTTNNTVDLKTMSAELRTLIYETSQHLESLAKQAMDKSDFVSSQRKRDHSDFLKELQKVTTEIENVIEDQAKVRTYTKTVGQMTTGVVEFCKITQVLLAQDEEDRQSIALMGYKEGKDSARPKTRTGAVVTLDKQCISCTNQSPIVISAFKMACLAYAPTPITYMRQSYTRRELIEMQGQLLLSSWDKVSPHFKFDMEVLKDEIDRLSTSMSRVSTSVPRPRSNSRPAKLFMQAPSAPPRAVGAMTRAFQSPHSMHLAELSDDGLPILTLGRRLTSAGDRSL